MLVTAWWGAATARLRRDAGNNNGKAEHRMSSSVELGAGFFKMIPDHESECANLLHTKDRVEESGEPFRNFFFMHIPKTAGTSFGGQCGCGCGPVNSKAHTTVDSYFVAVRSTLRNHFRVQSQEQWRPREGSPLLRLETSTCHESRRMLRLCH